MKAMILAAGEGTRLRPLTLKAPKLLLPIGGLPLIQWMLSWLKNYGIQEIAINLFHLGEKVSSFLGDGSAFGVKIVYSPEEALLGTAGGVKRMEHFFDSAFVVVYGDVLTDFDLSAMIRFHREKNSQATLALWEAPNPSEVGIVNINEEGRILRFVEKPLANSGLGNLASGGIYILEKDILQYIPAEGPSDFAYDVFPKLIEFGIPLYGYRLKPEDYLLDIGGPEKYQKANEDVKAGKVRLLKCIEASGIASQGKKRKAVFLDRDGTIARDVHYCRSPEDFELFPTVPDAIRLLNEKGFKVVVITNQSGIARGYFTEETLAQIHDKMKRELARCGAWVDAIHYCPHHPDNECECRKPKTALFQRAAEEHDIDFGASYVVGDMQMDIEAGKALGCHTILVTTGPGKEESIVDPPDYVADSLLEAVHWIIKEAK